jgi:hypothetical protein
VCWFLFFIQIDHVVCDVMLSTWECLFMGGNIINHPLPCVFSFYQDVYAPSPPSNFGGPYLAQYLTLLKDSNTTSVRKAPLHFLFGYQKQKSTNEQTTYPQYLSIQTRCHFPINKTNCALNTILKTKKGWITSVW